MNNEFGNEFGDNEISNLSTLVLSVICGSYLVRRSSLFVTQFIIIKQY